MVYLRYGLYSRVTDVISRTSDDFVTITVTELKKVGKSRNLYAFPQTRHVRPLDFYSSS